MLLSLPVKPYICKFLLRHLGEDYQLANTDSFGRYLYGLLRQPRNDRQYEQYLGRYTAKFLVRIVPHLVADRACKNCTAQTIVLFSSFVESIFFQEFHQFVQVRVELDLMQAKQAIEQFCQRHDLTEDDVRYETLKRNWGRYWQQEKKRLESQKSPSGLSLAA